MVRCYLLTAATLTLQCTAFTLRIHNDINNNNIYNRLPSLLHVGKSATESGSIDSYTGTFSNDIFNSNRLNSNVTDDTNYYATQTLANPDTIFQPPDLPMDPPPFFSDVTQSLSQTGTRPMLSRREWIKVGSTLLVGTAIASNIPSTTTTTKDHSKPATTSNNNNKKVATTTTNSATTVTSTNPSTPSVVTTDTKKISPVNLTQIAKQTHVNVTLESSRTRIQIDSAKMQKIETVKLPSWIPWQPKPVVVKDISDSEILLAAGLAGAAVELVRTALLYPLLTLKTRVQTEIYHHHGNGNRKLQLGNRLRIADLNARKHLNDGKLYAGILPTLLVSVPATGLYYGVRDVVKRDMKSALPGMDELGYILAAITIADIVSLILRTPADTLSIRLQAATGNAAQSGTETPEETAANIQSRVDGWLTESIISLPAVILTDLPFLLSKAALTNMFIHGYIDIGTYEITAILIAMLCAALTTPFDVVRTRILVDSDGDPTNGADGGSRKGVIETFQNIIKEGEGGFLNLYAGWLERTAYLGIGRAWIEPLQLVAYVAIRDILLLEYFK